MFLLRRVVSLNAVPNPTMWTGRADWASAGLRCGSGHGLLPLNSQVIPRFAMAHRVGSYFHLHLVSDATGETLTTVARAATAQYTKVLPVEHVYPLVRTQKQLDRVLAEIEESPGIVLYTLLEDSLVSRLEKHCRELSLPCLSILGPVLQMLQSYLGTETSHRVGAQHTLNADYFKRIDALNFTMLHDDGQHLEGLEDADVVLVGVSRTSKAWRKPMSCWSGCPAPRRRRRRSISPTAASAPPMCRWCRAFRCRTNSRR